MAYPKLEEYLGSLLNHSNDAKKLWVDNQNRVQGRFKNCSLTSLFQATLNANDGTIYAFDAFPQTYSAEDNGLSVWQLLMNGATDDESIELDRLARTIHIINFFRQIAPSHAKVIIDVHDRLLTAVNSNHGAAFSRIISGLELPQGQIILQLPSVKSSQSWALSHVLDNYRLNGFQVATRAIDVTDAIFQINLLQPSIVRIDITRIGTGDRLPELIRVANSKGSKLLFGRIETDTELRLIIDAADKADISKLRLLVQGPLISTMDSSLSNIALHDISSQIQKDSERGHYAFD